MTISVGEETRKETAMIPDARAEIAFEIECFAGVWCGVRAKGDGWMDEGGTVEVLTWP
jgi:hypothetical protein